MGKSAKAKQRRIKTYRHVPEVCITQCINLVRVMLWHAVRALQTTLYTPHIFSLARLDDIEPRQFFPWSIAAQRGQQCRQCCLCLIKTNHKANEHQICSTVINVFKYCLGTNMNRLTKRIFVGNLPFYVSFCLTNWIVCLFVCLSA